MHVLSHMEQRVLERRDAREPVDKSAESSASLCAQFALPPGQRLGECTVARARPLL